MMMQNERKFSTTTNHSFNKSAGLGCNELKKGIIDKFAEQGIEVECSESQANQMNKHLCWFGTLIYYLYGHIKRPIELVILVSNKF